MSVVKSHRLNISDLSFSDVKSNENGGKTIYLNHKKNKFYMQTPVMSMPYDMSVYDKGDYPKYSIELSYRDLGEDYRVNGFHENMEAIDKLLIENGVKNSMTWFKKKKTNEDVMSALYNPIVKKSKDKETGEIDGRYPDTIRLKLPFRDGEPKFDIMDMDGNPIKNKDPEKLFVKGANLKAIVRSGGVWIVGGKYGVTWTVEKIRVDAPESLDNYSFVADDTDDDDSGDSGSEDESDGNEVEDSDSD